MHRPVVMLPHTRAQHESVLLAMSYTSLEALLWSQQYLDHAEQTAHCPATWSSK